MQIESECTINISRSKFNGNLKFIKLDKYDCICIIKGDINNKENLPFRLHSGCITGDIFCSKRCDCGFQLDYFFNIMNDNDDALLLYVPLDEGRGIGLFEKLKAYSLIEKKHLNTFEANTNLNKPEDNRNFDYIDDILNYFNIKSINIYTNNPDKITSNKISNIINIPLKIEEFNFSYLQTKQNVKNHSLKIENYINIEKSNKSLNNKNIVILHTKWNQKYVKELVNGFCNKLNEYGKNNYIFKQVSGAFDLISGAINLIKENNLNNIDCFIFIGILLKGETSHYDFLMNSLGNGLQQFQLKYEKPIINGVLTCENEEQIKNRTLFNNHGVHWATALVELM